MSMSFDELVNKVINQESGNNPNAVNERTGASGLMQVMQATARDPGYGVAPLNWDMRFDRAANRRFGEDYLGAMINHYGGDQERALVAYNWGPGNANKWDGDRASLPEETRNYLAKILDSGMGTIRPQARPQMLPQQPPQMQQPPQRMAMLPEMAAPPVDPVQQVNNLADFMDLLNQNTSQNANAATQELGQVLPKF